ncbi:MAG TPA: hypothetical protein VFR81_11315 [Longimicrobium sp.]|nr:hypothetical protein [Longimicrobium sp.]
MERLRYRVCEEGDLPGLLRLWEEAGWGTLTPQQWREWFVDGPEGPCLITVAVDADGEVVAQEVFAPSRVSVAGREARALRFSAPILRSEIRGESLLWSDHPLVGLYKAAAAAARERGFEIVYSLPEPAWLRVLRLAPRYGVPRFESTSFGCSGLPLETAVLSGIERFARNVEARPVAAFGAEYEELWRSARETFPIACGVVRDGAWLTFRNSGRIALEIRDAGDGSLVGYSATKRQTGLLADVLARDPESLRAVIAATAIRLAEQRLFDSLQAMHTPALDPALRALGFAPVDYTFAFTCNALGGDGLERVAPELWYVMPGD